MSDMPSLAQLWSASQVCEDCGRAWGSPLCGLDSASFWQGRCSICERDEVVCHVRYYGYLRRGVAIVEGKNRYAS